MYFLSLPVGGTLKKFARFARVIEVSPQKYRCGKANSFVPDQKKPIYMYCYSSLLTLCLFWLCLFRLTTIVYVCIVPLL